MAELAPRTPAADGGAASGSAQVVQFIWWVDADGAVQYLSDFTWDGNVNSVPTLLAQIQQGNALADAWVRMMAKGFQSVKTIQRSFSPPIPITVDMKPPS